MGVTRAMTLPDYLNAARSVLGKDATPKQINDYAAQMMSGQFPNAPKERGILEKSWTGIFGS